MIPYFTGFYNHAPPSLSAFAPRPFQFKSQKAKDSSAAQTHTARSISRGESMPPTPAPTPTPTPVPTPTPTPTPTPVPVGKVIGTGSFVSNTGVPMNIRADWEALLLDEQHVGVRVKVYLESYSIQIQESRGAVNVSVGDNYQTADTPSLDIDDNASIHSSLIATTEHVLNLAPGQQKSFPVQVQYLFRGTYFRQEIDTVECGGAIDLMR